MQISTIWRSDFKYVSFLVIPSLLLIFLNTLFFKLPSSDALGIFLWLYIASVWSLIGSFILKKIFSSSEQGVFGAAKILGFSIWIFFQYWSSFLIGGGILKDWILLVLLSLVGILIVFNWRTNEVSFWGTYQKVLYRNELIFTSLFLGCLVFCSFYPDLFWGEKPMDMSMISSMGRSSEFPPQDPWVPGYQMKYYFMGYYSFSKMGTLFGIAPQTVYFLALSTCFGFLGMALFSIFSFAQKRIWLALTQMGLILIASNWRGIKFALSSSHSPDQSTFWDLTRVFSNKGFAEYPFWSFAFRDLHPHVMSYGITLTLIFFLFQSTRKSETKLWRWGVILLLLATNLTLNAWDFLICSLFIGFWTLELFWQRRWKLAFAHMLTPLLSVLFYLPLFLDLKSGKKARYGLVNLDTHNLSQFWEHEGQWVLLLLIFLLGHIFLRWRRKFQMGVVTSLKEHIFWPVVALAISLGLDYGTNMALSWEMMAIVIVLLTLNTLYQNFGYELKQKEMVRFFIVSGMGLLLVAETFIYHDRINTVFKSYNIIYICLGISALIASNFHWEVFKRLWRKAKILTIPSFGYLVSFGVLILLIGGTVTSLSALRGYRYSRGIPHLDGYKFVELLSPHERHLIDWINKNIYGPHIMLEHSAESFQYDSQLVSSATGLNSFLGWKNHVYLRGLPYDELKRRGYLINTIYDSTDALTTHQNLKREGIEFILVGPVERQTYDKLGIIKFKEFPLFFQEIFHSGPVSFYKILD